MVNGVVQGPVLDLAVNSGSERGLLGMALHPNFATNGWVYLYWTESATGVDSTNLADLGSIWSSTEPVRTNRIDRFIWNGSTLTLDRPIIRLRSYQADPGQPLRGNHNGGVIRFGPDGKLVPVREWMILLDERLRLETRRHLLLSEADQVVRHWRNVGLTGMIALSLGAAFLIVFLPIRYRLQANRELVKVRERIAGDLHDEVGSNLGSIQMIADLAEGRSGPSAELKRIQRIAAETVSAVRDIVWLLRPTGDHRIGTVEHLRETSSIMLETLEWKFTANEEAWQVELPEELNRDLFLYFRESLHNIMRHAKAKSVEIRAEESDHTFRLVIADDGVGIAPERLDRPATFRALRARSEALRATFEATSKPEEGTRLVLTIPLPKKRKR
ncbi:MAG: hypothetical protein EOP84_01025 [Verrucomicrobiaceae bacterium]|nr:MAG: hypothetical protein EOP84_01025 [Verrucomicrobiaceae bacterium]